MDDVIRVNEQFYILATSALRDQNRVLKHGKTFGVFDRTGDFEGVGPTEQGLFHEGTRFLSKLTLTLNGERPLLLSSMLRQDNAVLLVDLSNRDIEENGEVVLPRGSVHIRRCKLLWEAGCYEQLRVSNYALHALTVSLCMELGSDFADIFEVRGTERERRGRMLSTVVDAAAVTLAYKGLDGVVRRTRILCSPAPQRVSRSSLEFELQLESRAVSNLTLTIGCDFEDQQPKELSYSEAVRSAHAEMESIEAESATIHTSNDEFNEWIRRSFADVHMMVAGNPEPWYPYGGVPWFNTVFGRDGIVTALECLWTNPCFAQGVLKYLAATQATERNELRDSEPGKIVHEMRRGEMASLGEVPFGCYYGSVDSTPLFVLLAGAYYERTADRELVESIWPNVQRALNWIEQYGDPDGDGFVEYFKRSPNGLAQQGWKDSRDSVFHQDGVLADGPIALCEVQGYVYAAKRYAAMLATILGFSEQAATLQKQAASLQRKFEEAFWCDDCGMYALALDGNKRPCAVRTSNAGQALLSEIASSERAHLTAQTLLGERMFSGWGIRTLAGGEPRYNPMSYHNGSIWPHDNALIAAGLARYGHKHGVIKILDALFDASTFLDLHRLPELYCGFDRSPGEGPTLYPVACSPQSWAAAAVFQLLGCALGIEIDAPAKVIRIRNPALPARVQCLQVQRLRVGESSVDLSFEGSGEKVGVSVTQASGDIRVESP